MPRIRTKLSPFFTVNSRNPLSGFGCRRPKRQQSAPAGKVRGIRTAGQAVGHMELAGVPGTVAETGAPGAARCSQVYGALAIGAGKSGVQWLVWCGAASGCNGAA